MARLHVRNGSTMSEHEIGAEPVTIGREGCDINLDDQTVSRHHATVREIGEGVTITDEGSTNGTLVNGRSITGATLLRPGDKVEIGGAEITLVGTSGGVAGGTVAVPKRPPLGGAVPAPNRAAVGPLVGHGAPPPPGAPGGKGARGRSPGAGAVVLAIVTVAGIVVGALFATGVLPPDDDGERKELTVQEVAQQVRPSTARINVEHPDGEGQGTGWVLDAEEGLLVTNFHVVAGGQAFDATINGATQDADLVAVAPCDDLAVLRVDDLGDVRALPLADQSEVDAGDTVVAVGYPANATGSQDFTVTSGIVSVPKARLDRQIPNLPRFPNVIQTQAPINPGNSGGPLLNLRAEVVGVNTLGSTSLQNQNFALGVDRVSTVSDKLRSGTSFGWTGAAIDSVELDFFSDEPVYLLSVGPSSPGTAAAGAGLGRPYYLAGIDSTPMDGSIGTYCNAVEDLGEGDSATFFFYAEDEAGDPLFDLDDNGDVVSTEDPVALVIEFE